MKTSIYTTMFNVAKHGGFDLDDAFANWSVYADQISVAVNTSDDDTLDRVMAYADRYPLSVATTDFSLKDDPFAYGKIENAALQNCTGDLLIQQNLDERFRCDKLVLSRLATNLYRNPLLKAYMVPVVDLFQSKERAFGIGSKWYLSKPGCYRGAVKFGIKADGRPDYNKTSTDELIDEDGNLVFSIPLFNELTVESLQRHVGRGMPVVYHLGYLNLKDRLERSIWWKRYWERATNGDENKHPTTMEELAAKDSFEHGLPLWPTSKDQP